jgi:hypothetical protein
MKKRKGHRYLGIVFLQDILGIHYDNLGLYKELLHLIEAKTWSLMNLSPSQFILQK